MQASGLLLVVISLLLATTATKTKTALTETDLTTDTTVATTDTATVATTDTAIATMTDTDTDNATLDSLASTFRHLRTQPSHFKQPDTTDTHDNIDQSNATWNQDVDASDSPMKQTMDRLLQMLGSPGTPAAAIIDALGEPDEYTASLDNPFQSPPFMPGPVIIDPQEDTNDSNTISDSSAVFMCYYWRARHDFLFFKVATDSSGQDVVIDAGWYNALE